MNESRDERRPRGERDNREGRPDRAEGRREGGREGRGRRPGHGRGMRGQMGTRGRRRGDIRRLLLAGLLEGPAHGYELMRRLEDRSGGQWRPSPGSVYPMLQQLEDEELVRSSEAEGRRSYELTDLGREQADPAALERLSDDTDEDAAHDLHAELRQLALAVRQVHAVGADAQLAEVADVLRQARQSVYRLLAES